MERIDAALKLAIEYGGVEGAHHKNWVIDQMVRVLAGKQYRALVKAACAGDEGPDTYEWDVGVAP